MTDAAAELNVAVRPLQWDDLEQMIAIDRMHTGRTRRRFFERRLNAAEANPEDFVHIGAISEGKLVGFVFARLLFGEFGRERAIASLDLIGVDSNHQERGYGHALLSVLKQMLQQREVRLLQSQADWTNHGLLKFFSSTGFELATRLVLDREVAKPLVEPTDSV